MNEKELSQEFTSSLEMLMRTKYLNYLLEFCQGEMRILVLVSILGDEQITPSDISAKTGMTRARIAAALGSLEKKGYINRAVNKDDRRRVMVTITEKGKNYVWSKRNEIQAIFDIFVLAMGEEDTSKLIDLIKKTGEILNNIPSDSPQYEHYL